MEIGARRDVHECLRTCFGTDFSIGAGLADLSQVEMGDVAGVVAAVDTEARLLPKDSQELVRESAVPALVVLDMLMMLLREEMVLGTERVAAQHAAHDVDLVTGLSAPLPLTRLRSSSSHCTTLSRLLKSSDWARAGWSVCEGGKRGPCMLLTTSLKGTLQGDEAAEGM